VFGCPIALGDTLALGGAKAIGAGGGAVESEGVRLVVPPGALTADVVISITAVSEPAPTDHDMLSPIFEFGPDGLSFVKPATIEIAATHADTAGATVLWSTPGGYEELATTAGAEGRYSASVVHFSRGLLGRRRQVLDSGTGGDAGTDASEAGTDASACLPYGSTCSIATGAKRCCNNVPCVGAADGAGYHCYNVAASDAVP
jgi:hypothetical protein